MTILVTGGAGFIGSNFIYYLLKKYPDVKVVCVDKLTYAGHIETLAAAADAPGFEFIKADICDAGAMNAVFDDLRPDAVVHFAAESHVDRSISDPGVFLRTNVLGTGVLLDACRDHGGIRFHQIGTDEVYGDLPLDRPDLLFKESSPIVPSSPYSASKAAADMLALAYHRTYGLPVTVSRCSNNYGPYQHPEKLIPLMITKAVKNEKLPVYGDGLNVRDWLYTEDHCRAVDLILRNGEPGRVYNIGGNNEVANIDIVKKILGILGRPESLISYVPDRKGHDRRYAIDASRIKDELGWEPLTNFGEGLRSTVEWYLDNTEWVRKVLS